MRIIHGNSWERCLQQDRTSMEKWESCFFLLIEDIMEILYGKCWSSYLSLDFPTTIMVFLFFRWGFHGDSVYSIWWYEYIFNVMEIYGHIWDIINFRFCNHRMICLVLAKGNQSRKSQIIKEARDVYREVLFTKLRDAFKNQSWYFLTFNSKTLKEKLPNIMKTNP